jgi:hypothetical protein
LEYLPFVELQRVMPNVNIPREVRNKARECFRKAFMRLSDGETRMLFLNTEGRVLRELAILTGKDRRVIIEMVQRPTVPRPFVLALARSHLTPPEVLQMISHRPSWLMDTSIRRALLANGKTPNKVKDLLKGKGR